VTAARALAAETLKLERTLSDLVNQAYGLTPAEIALMWQTAPPRMPIQPPGCPKPAKRMSRVLPEMLLPGQEFHGNQLLPPKRFSSIGKDALRRVPSPRR
jgi:hypothetical protein